MEASSYKPSMDGTEGVESRGTNVKVANQRAVRSSDVLLRFVAVVTTLVSIIVLAVSKQTKTVPVTVLPNLPPIQVEATAKWQYISSFVYLMVANIIALAYATLSLLLSLAGRAGSNSLGVLVLVVLDLVIMALLLSANGAAAGVGIIALRGNSHVQWNKVCNVVDSNCRKVATSIIISLAAAGIFLLLIILHVVHLRKRSH